MSATGIFSHDATPVPSGWLLLNQFHSGTSERVHGRIPEQMEDACSKANEESASARNLVQRVALDCRDRDATANAQSPWEMPRAVALMLTLLRMLRSRPPRHNRPPHREWTLPNGCVLAVRYRSMNPRAEPAGFCSKEKP
jgi:hypothetical protein